MLVRRRGNSLLEVIAASTLIALAIAPALRMLRDTVEIGQQIEEAEAMATLCASRLEVAMAKTCATWNTAAETGDYSGIGYPQLRYAVVKSDAAIDGGIAGKLIAITATVWNDADGDSVLDAAEHRQQLATKIAKMARYDP